MELKKNKKYELEDKAPLFFSIGLVVTLLLVILAFNWREAITVVGIKEQVSDPYDRVYTVPATQIPDPEPPKPEKVLAPAREKAVTQTPIFVESDLPETITGQQVSLDNDPNANVDLSGAFSAEPAEETGDAPLEVVEDMPSFPGGMKAFYDYVAKNVQYPERARSNNVSGKVFVQFVVDKDGSITDAKAIKGIGFGCDEAAVKVLEGSPKWNPGKQRGRAVKVRMVLPISFTLD